jgi:hypothetical protein
MAVLLLATLMPASPASGHRRLYLSTASARRAIMTYERDYWQGQGVTARIVNCVRRSGVRVTCEVAGESAEGARISASDSATLLPQDMIRVHPGRFEEVLVLRG